MINPSVLCRKHLLGEHVELHMLCGSIKKNKSLEGFVRNGLIEVHNIQQRHEELVAEMKRRGYNHKSPLPDINFFELGSVDRQKSFQDLMNRCEECRKNAEVVEWKTQQV